jgi:DNA primase
MASLDLEKIRNVDIIDLAERLGFERDKYDKKEYRRDDIKVSIDDKRGRFNSFTSDVHGAGAIDFVMKTENLSFQQAAQMIADMYAIPNVENNAFSIQRDQNQSKSPKENSNNIIKDYKKETEKAKQEPDEKILIMPEKADTDKEIKEYLTKERAIDPKVVNALISKGYIYQEKQHNNVVFIAKDTNGKTTGAEIKGTDPSVKFKGMAKGSDKNAGAFTLKLNNSKESLVLTESALDAISYCSLNKTENATVISTSGLSPAITPAISNIIEKDNIKNVKIAYDKDKPGQEAAEKLKDALQEKYNDINIEIKTPEKGKDWNENLQLETQKPQIKITIDDKFLTVENAGKIDKFEIKDPTAITQDKIEKLADKLKESEPNAKVEIIDERTKEKEQDKEYENPYLNFNNDIEMDGR